MQSEKSDDEDEDDSVYNLNFLIVTPSGQVDNQLMVTYCDGHFQDILFTLIKFFMLIKKLRLINFKTIRKVKNRSKQFIITKLYQQSNGSNCLYKYSLYYLP